MLLLPNGSDTLLRFGFAGAALRALLSPLADFWMWSRGFSLVQAAISGAAKCVMLGLPLLAAEDPRHCCAVYVAVLLPAIASSVLFRVIIGVHTPSAVRRFSPFAVPGLHPLLTIRMDRLLESSALQLVHEEPYRLGGLVSISYQMGSGKLQEGIDLGGLFRDWLVRVVRELCSEQRAFVCSETVDGVSYLRLSGRTRGLTGLQRCTIEDDEPQFSRAAVFRALFEAFSNRGEAPQGDIPASWVYRCMGRVLAVALNNGLPVGASFAPPLLRALLVPPGETVDTVCSADDLRYVSECMWKYLSECAASGDREAVKELELSMAGLQHNGRFVRVTLANVREYMRRHASAKTVGYEPPSAATGVALAVVGRREEPTRRRAVRVDVGACGPCLGGTEHGR
eukprot:TRINITY_DN13624_c0_g1_i2.p1 TRINITY_DN13624_c0_g1~~TRINITY_DN13624_c0_g1_i2.p1  ORF type:complete len:397 (+),score=61.48 TRINITY_DN13624_c0_g1_i2:939-2129(+)